MSDSTESSVAILTRLFTDPDAILGQEWLDSVESGWTTASLHRLVVTNGTLSAAKTKELYGHFWTKTQMKGISGPYWQKELVETVKKELKKELVRLNGTDLTMEERLKQLQTDSVGGILLVTKVIEEDGTTSKPFITILAAPSVATFIPPIGDNGVLYEDVWEETVLDRFKPKLVMEKAHCPVLGAQEGFI